MCGKDGGVRIFEQVAITPAQAEVMPRVGGYLSVTPEQFMKPEALLFIRIKSTVISEVDPRVSRIEETIMRRSDQRVLGVAVRYAWSHNIFPAGDQHWCPDDLRGHYKGISNVYRIEEPLTK